MTHFPDDDPRLKAFLQQHRPEAPPAAPDLEDRLMAAIATTPQGNRGNLRQFHRRTWVWLAPPAIAAGLVAGVVGYRNFTPATSEAEIANLETFMESTWQSTIDDGTADDVFPFSSQVATRQSTTTSTPPMQLATDEMQPID